MSAPNTAPPKYQAPGTAPANTKPLPDGDFFGVATGQSDGKNSKPPQQFQDAANQMGPDIDWGKFEGMSATGDAARNQAIDAAYGQATSRLDPQWQRREEGMNTRLLNQGLDPSSEAYKNAMSDLGMQRNDAYTGAMNSAIGQGTQAGGQIFQQGMQTRQQALSEALRRRKLPMDELSGWQSLYTDQGKLDAQGNPLNGIGDVLSGILDLIP